MKNKIITLLLKWARKIIYKYDKSLPPFIVQERNMQKIRSEHILSPIEKDLWEFKEEEFMNHLKQELGMNIAKVMHQIGAIRYEIDSDFNSGNVKITATTYVPEKL